MYVSISLLCCYVHATNARNANLMMRNKYFFYANENSSWDKGLREVFIRREMNVFLIISDSLDRRQTLR